MTIHGEVQLRPIHGDPKTANVMIDDATSKGTAIIDLDTVKPGLVLYDIGDCLRSCCNPAGEECTDFTKIYFDVDFCFALLNGYQHGEKWRILEAGGGAAAAELERLGRRYDMKSALAKKDGDFRELVRDTLKALNRD